MTETSSGSRVCISRLILIPAVITLGVTLLRLVGELQHWPSLLFSTAAGGGAAIVGIFWLPFIFGPYFAVKLARAGKTPAGTGKAIGFALLGFGLLFVGSFLQIAPQVKFPGKFVVGLVLMLAAAGLQFVSWAPLALTLVAYGYAARIPVAIVMFFAIRGSWGTHYDALPPGVPADIPFWSLYFRIGLLPQLVFWVIFTLIVGAVCGGVAAAITLRRKPAEAAA